MQSPLANDPNSWPIWSKSRFVSIWATWSMNLKWLRLAKVRASTPKCRARQAPILGLVATSALCRSILSGLSRSSNRHRWNRACCQGKAPLYRRRRERGPGFTAGNPLCPAHGAPEICLPGLRGRHRSSQGEASTVRRRAGHDIHDQQCRGMAILLGICRSTVRFRC